MHLLISNQSQDMCNLESDANIMQRTSSLAARRSFWLHLQRRSYLVALSARIGMSMN